MGRRSLDQQLHRDKEVVACGGFNVVIACFTSSSRPACLFLALAFTCCICCIEVGFGERDERQVIICSVQTSRTTVTLCWFFWFSFS